MRKKITFLLAFLLFQTAISFSQSEGPRDAMSAIYSAFGCLACPGGNWQNLTNISQPDHLTADVVLTAYPMCFQSTCYYSRILYAYDFGFTIPAGATILGVTADVMRNSTSASGIVDSAVTLYTGEPVGSNHASAALWTLNTAIITYGDSTDTWNYTLTADSVNNPQFGLAVLVMDKSLSATFVTASVDHITMTVYYSTGTGIASQTRSSTFNIRYNKSQSALELFFPVQQEINAVKVFDAIGNNIFTTLSFDNSKGKQSIEMPFLRQGIYVAAIETGGKTITRKFFVE